MSGKSDTTATTTTTATIILLDLIFLFGLVISLFLSFDFIPIKTSMAAFYKCIPILNATIKSIINSQSETVDIYLLWLSLICKFAKSLSENRSISFPLFIICCSSFEVGNKIKCGDMEMGPLEIRHRTVNLICCHPITVQFASAFRTGTTVKGCANMLLSNGCFLFPNHKRNLNGFI